MASILDRYGIKEVADVTFYKLDENGVPMYPVLYMDTLKVTTTEQTAEQTEARGGKGNAPLIIWDFNKEINVTLEDALFSAKSLAIMFGNGQVQDLGADAKIMRTEQFLCTAAVADTSTLPETAFGWNKKYTANNGKVYEKLNPKFYAEDCNVSERATTVGATSAQLKSLEEGKKYFCTYDLKVEGSMIEVSANTFPGTYYVTGDTYARNQASGEDEFFQLVFPRAKVTSENTITLEAEGEPSVFNLSLRILRPDDGKMMKLVKYNLLDGADATEASGELVHNHYLDVDNQE